MVSGGGWRVTKPALRAPLLHYSRRRTRCQMPRNQDGVFRRSGAAEQRPRSCSGIILATPSEWSRRSASLRCSTRHGRRLRNSAQGKGPIGCATAECRRAECSGRPPRSGCNFLPLGAGRHAPSHVHWRCSVHLLSGGVCLTV